MQVQRQSNGACLGLETTSLLGAGGEARIYTIAYDSLLVAKIYHTPTEAQARKLAIMIAHPPDDPMAAQGHASFAWPVDLLRTTDRQPRIVGFLMPYVPRMWPLLTYYNPLTRRQRCPLFNARYLHRTAHNLAAAMRALHARGYVIGDVNESNILVTDTALVTLVDTDSFQVREPHNGVVYRCPVGKPEFTPPELQGRFFVHLDRAPEHDLFGLAVLIFQLLMEGTHPFAGVFLGKGDPPPYEARIAAGHFPYSRRQHGPYRPMPSSPPSAMLHPALQELFVRCFEEGHHRPSARPDAQTWQHALQEAENALVSCSCNDQHLYSHHLSACPWCERTARLQGRDPFPSRQALQHQSPLPPTAPASMPRASSGTPAPQRPSRLVSIVTGTLWGAASGILLEMVVYVARHQQLSQIPPPSLLLAALAQSGWGVVWGAIWGTMWGMCRLPVASGHSGRLRRMLTGALLGTCLGIMTSVLVGMTPGGLVETHQSPFLEVLSRTHWQAMLPMLRDILIELIRSARSYVISGTVVGGLLGVTWGMFGK